MEDIIASELIKLLPVLISFILSNLFTIILIALILIAVGIMLLLGMKHRTAQRRKLEAEGALQEAMRRINTTMTSEYFRDLELGLVHGETARKWQALQDEGFALREETTRLERVLAELNLSFFSTLGQLTETSRVRSEVLMLQRRVDNYHRELQRMQRSSTEARSEIKHLEAHWHKIRERIDQLQSTSGYALDGLRLACEEAERQLKEVVQASVFDTVQATMRTESLQRTLHALEAKITATSQSIETLREMKERINTRGEQWLKEVTAGGSDGHNGRIAEEVLAKVEAMLADLESTIGRGEDVDLREAAVQIEQTFKQAMNLE